MHRKRIYTAILAVLILSIIIVWAVEIQSGKMPYTDQWTRGFVDLAADTKVYVVFRAITDLGSRQFLIPFTVLAAGLLMYVYRDWVPGFLFSAGTFGSHLLNTLIKEIVQRERPRIFIEANAEGYSFPSGHAMTSLVCYGLFVYFITRRITSPKAKLTIKIIFGLLVFLIGLSRYIINVHYLTDVLVGYAAGAFVLTGVIFLSNRIKRGRS